MPLWVLIKKLLKTLRGVEKSTNPNLKASFLLEEIVSKILMWNDQRNGNLSEKNYWLGD